MARYRDTEAQTGSPSCRVAVAALLQGGGPAPRRRVRSTCRAPAGMIDVGGAGDRPYLDTYANIDKAGGGALPSLIAKNAEELAFR
jgi:hypothetical protein